MHHEEGGFVERCTRLAPSSGAYYSYIYRLVRTIFASSCPAEVIFRVQKSTKRNRLAYVMRNSTRVDREGGEIC